MKEAVIKSKFEFNLEALRGFAAVLVVFTHCFGFSTILNGAARTGIWRYDFPGHTAVLIFFILSGYVIGLTSKQQLTWATTGAYLKKRFLRLYPIYLIGILVALLITRNSYSAGAVGSNLVFLQRVTSEPLYEVGVNWSLNYEVLFYLLFIPISIYALRPAYVFLLSLLIAFLFQYVVPIPLLAMYGFGFCFWLTGLWLSQTKATEPRNASRYALAGLLCLVLAFNSLNFARDIIQYKLHLDNVRGHYTYAPTSIMFSDFSLLPLGVLLISYFTNKSARYHSILLAFVLANPVLYFILQLYTSRNNAMTYDSTFVAYLFYIAGALLLVIGRNRPQSASNQLPSFMIELGSISYGVYLIHFVMIVLLGRVSFWQGSNETLLLRTALVLLLTIGAGYLLEKVWQPFAVRQLRKLRVFQ